MSDFNSLGKEYLRPDYSEEDTNFDDHIGGPSEDDDLELEDDDVSDYDEGEEDKKIEEISKSREKLTEKIMEQTPFTQSSPWGGSNNNTWGGGSTTNKKEIDRRKEVVFCDVLDCLIETLASNGKPGLLPRGIYDIRLRFEVWDKIACFNPNRIYAMIPRNLILSSNGYNSWEILLNYVICSLSEYLRVPFGNCQILTQGDFNQGKDVMMNNVIKRDKINRNLAIQIGLESGLYGQSNRDYLASEKVGIDYIDLGQLMNLYY